MTNSRKRKNRPKIPKSSSNDRVILHVSSPEDQEVYADSTPAVLPPMPSPRLEGMGFRYDPFSDG